MTRRPPRSPLFPSPTLSRSSHDSRPTTHDCCLSQRRHRCVDLGGEIGPEKKHLKSTHGDISQTLLFFFNDPAPPEISPLPLPDALPIFSRLTTHDSRLLPLAAPPSLRRSRRES